MSNNLYKMEIRWLPRGQSFPETVKINHHRIPSPGEKIEVCTQFWDEPWDLLVEEIATCITEDHPTTVVLCTFSVEPERKQYNPPSDGEKEDK